MYTYAIAKLSLCRGPPATRLEGEQLVWPKNHFCIRESNSLSDTLLCTYCYAGAPCFRQRSCCVAGIFFLGPERLSSARAILSYPLTPLPFVLLGEIHPRVESLVKAHSHISHAETLPLDLWSLKASQSFLKSVGSKLSKLPILTT